MAKPRPIGHRIVGEVVSALFIEQVKVTDEERTREREILEKEIATVREQSKARIAGFEPKTPPSSE